MARSSTTFRPGQRPVFMGLGKDHHSWKGGRFQHGDYIKVYKPDHPRARDGHIYEHVAKVEEAIGHILPPQAVVHHINEIRTDNRNENLVACENAGYHNLIHRRMRALRACGHAHFLKCRFCKKYDNPQGMCVVTRREGGIRGHHRECANADARKRRILH